MADSISTGLKKSQGQSLTACDVKNSTDRLKQLIFADQVYLCLRNIPGSPPYWQNFKREATAMVAQLGCPTWFMTSSCADLRWNVLFEIIGKTRGISTSAEEIDELSYDDRCKMLNLNPVVVAKHFQYRLECFFKEVLLSSMNPIEKIIYYAVRIEFQMQGSPHAHCLLWTSDCPQLTEDNIQDCIDFIDQHVMDELPDINYDPELYK